LAVPQYIEDNLVQSVFQDSFAAPSPRAPDGGETAAGRGSQDRRAALVGTLLPFAYWEREWTGDGGKAIVTVALAYRARERKGAPAAI
jgi:hypothetical protein